jgi:hypothetical protein
MVQLYWIIGNMTFITRQAILDIVYWIQVVLTVNPAGYPTKNIIVEKEAKNR